VTFLRDSSVPCDNDYDNDDNDDEDDDDDGNSPARHLLSSCSALSSFPRRIATLLFSFS